VHVHGSESVIWMPVKISELFAQQTTQKLDEVVLA
jgi:hypothetical protein